MFGYVNTFYNVFTIFFSIKNGEVYIRNLFKQMLLIQRAKTKKFWKNFMKNTAKNLFMKFYKTTANPCRQAVSSQLAYLAFYAL